MRSRRDSIALNRLFALSILTEDKRFACNALEVVEALKSDQAPLTFKATSMIISPLSVVQGMVMMGMPEG